MICASCPAETMQARDGLCKGCRLRAATRRRQKYHFTPELDSALRRAYAERTRSGVGARVGELMRRTGWPRFIFQNRATRQGLRFHTAKDWRPEDVAWLLEHAGELTINRMAAQLHRSPSAVKQKLHTMDVACRVTEGFAIHELAQLMGVHHFKVERWIAQRWLLLDGNGRIAHASVERFVWERMDAYRFASCEEWWLKTMLKPRVAGKVLAVARQQRRTEAA